jgi:hypothetical protein
MRNNLAPQDPSSFRQKRPPSRGEIFDTPHHAGSMIFFHSEDDGRFYEKTGCRLR